MTRSLLLATMLVITACSFAQTTTTKPSNPWSFRNHVIPVLTKAACNSGGCHGALAGKGGLKLSLRGYDPVSDHNALTRQTSGRRVVSGSPESSLMLLKPTMEIGHGGGVRIKKGSSDYKVIADWIRAGAPAPTERDATVRNLQVIPDKATLKPGDTQQIRVKATYSDGRSEDVTRWVKYSSNESSVASIDDDGKVKVNGSGETAITVWFSSKVAFATITSPFHATQRPTPNAPPPASSMT